MKITLPFLIFLFIFPLFAQHDYPVPSVVEPLSSYDILEYDFVWHFTLSPALSYDVREIIRLETKEPVQRIVLDCVGLNVYSCSLMVETSSLPFTTDSRSLTIELDRTYMANETLSIAINYSGGSNSAFYSTFTRYGARIYYTLGFASTARYIFPCVDHPLDKALFSAEFYVPSGYLVASNGELIEENDDGTVYFCRYRTSYPMATYLFAIHIFPYARWFRTTDDGLPIVVYYYPRDSANVFMDFGRVGEILSFYEGLFGRYPFEKVGYAEAPVFAGYGAMENQTMITFGDRLINGRRTYESVIAHELSHQWFGDAVSLADWRDFWLNEGFAQYAELLFIERFYPSQFASAIHSLHQEFFNNEATEGRFSLYDPEVYLGYTVYYKGASVMHMLRFILGDSLFFTSLREYYNRFKYGNVTTDSFIVVCEDVSGVRLGWFFDEWVYERGYPEFEYFFRNVGDTTKVILAQVQRDAPRAFVMPVEIMLSGSGGRVSLFREWVRDTVETLSFVCGFEVDDVIIDPDEWLLAKISRSTLVEKPSPVPFQFELHAYPNPFNDALRIVFDASFTDDVKILLVDIAGRILKEINFYGDRFEFVWDGLSNDGRKVPSGVYFVVADTRFGRVRKSVVLLR